MPDLRKFVYCLFAHLDTYGNVEDCDTKQRMNIVMDILDANKIPKVYDSETSLEEYYQTTYEKNSPAYLAISSSIEVAICEKKLEIIRSLERDRIETVEIPLRLICTAINALPTPAERVSFLEDLDDTTVAALQANYAKEHAFLRHALRRYYELEEEKEREDENV